MLILHTLTINWTWPAVDNGDQWNAASLCSRASGFKGGPQGHEVWGHSCSKGIQHLDPGGLIAHWPWNMGIRLVQVRSGEVWEWDHGCLQASALVHAIWGGASRLSRVELGHGWTQDNNNSNIVQFFTLPSSQL